MTNNIKNLKKFYKSVTLERGFALLYSVVISSMILAIALGVSNIAFKELIFSTSAKDANDAFYAADTAAECALFHDNSSFTAPMYCNAEEFSILEEPKPDFGFDLAFKFIISHLGNSQKACAIVTVNKTADNLATKISSVGYNNGGETLGFCNPTGTSVQRALELNY